MNYICTPLKSETVMKKHLFSIPFVGLKRGEHKFSYDLGKEFFLEKGAEDFENPDVVIHLILEKNTGFIILKFEVGGAAVVTCDRCGNPLRMELWDEFKILVKHTDDPVKMNLDEEDPDVFYISKSESHIEVSDWLYEFAMLSIPNQRTCKDEEKGGEQCNKEVLEKLAQMSKLEEKNANNIWKDLTKFNEN